MIYLLKIVSLIVKSDLKIFKIFLQFMHRALIFFTYYAKVDICLKGNTQRSIENNRLKQYKALGSLVKWFM